MQKTIIALIMLATTASAQTTGTMETRLQWEFKSTVGVQGVRVWMDNALLETIRLSDEGYSTTTIVRGLDAGTSYTFTLTTFDRMGNESIHSEPYTWRGNVMIPPVRIREVWRRKTPYLLPPPVAEPTETTWGMQ